MAGRPGAVRLRPLSRGVREDRRPLADQKDDPHPAAHGLQVTETEAEAEAEALYVRDGDAFVGTACTQGAWAHGGQAGGAVLALLGHVLEDIPTLTPMSLTRLTVDIVRPVPVGERLRVNTEVIREGKKIQVVDLTVAAGDVVTTRARALRVRDCDVG